MSTVKLTCLRLHVLVMIALVPADSFLMAPPSFLLSCRPASAFSSTLLQNDASSASSSVGKGFVKSCTTAEKPASIKQVKQELLDLLSRLPGQNEFRRVEELVNLLEDRYTPAQTLNFFNMAISGSWQLLFSTNLGGTPNPQKFRLRELVQTISCRGKLGNITNTAIWDLAEDSDGNFQISGSFSVLSNYTITQGARKVLELQDHIVKITPGSPLPSDVQHLIGLLHRAMPKEMFDPSDHGVDTTYLDADLRIVRYTGPRLEGIRDILVRSVNAQ